MNNRSPRLWAEAGGTVRPEDVAVLDTVLPLGQLLVRSATRWPDHPAVVFPDHALTYAELFSRAWSVARSLIGLGIGRGEHVGVLMTNHPDMAAAYFGIWFMGGVAVPINARYRSAELSHLVKDADLVAVVTTDCGDRVNFVELLDQSVGGFGEHRAPAPLNLPEYPRLRHVVSLAEAGHPAVISGEQFARLGAEVSEESLTTRVAGAALRDVALILYTSGTTAAPRGAIHSHESFGRTWLSTGNLLGMTHEDRFWDPLPLFHVAALGPMIFTIGAGGTFLTDYWFEAGRGLAMIEKERATVLYPTFPPIMQDLLNHPAFPNTNFDSVRAFVNVAPPETLREFQRLAPHAVQVTTFGGTEVGPASFTRLTDDEQARLGTCGLPQPGVEIKVVDPETGEECPPGQRGELFVRGFNVFAGYYGDPEKTAASLDADGWYHSGDIGEKDAAGRVTYRGRLKEMMKIGGENVAPVEIESHLSSHPAVNLVQVVGVPDERLTEVAVAFVELRPGHEATAEELIEYCRGRIASFKVPRDIRFVTEWPMSATKIQRFRLREQYLAELEAKKSSA